MIQKQVDIGEIGNDVIKRAKGDEKDFLNKFVQTQMFVTLVEDHF